MANAFTGTAAYSALVQTAYDRLAEFALRSQPLHREIADKKAAQQSMPGSNLVFSIYQDLAVQTGTLTETVDPDAIALGNPTTVTVTIAEYGAAALRTRLLNLEAFSDVDPAIANIMAFNMLDSVDSIVLSVLTAGTNVIRQAGGVMTINSGANSAITSTDTITSSNMRAAPVKLRAGKALPRRGSLYWCAMHPEVSYDLRSESGSIAGWRAPQVYSGPGAVWAGEVGEYEGAVVVETNRAFNDTTGSGSTRVFYTLFAGQQALAEMVAEEFHVVAGPITDKLMRFRPIGWTGTAGWSIFRQAALYQVRTTSSIHNT
jgi:N4-gp56 family major capsid protein